MIELEFFKRQDRTTFLDYFFGKPFENFRPGPCVFGWMSGWLFLSSLHPQWAGCFFSVKVGVYANKFEVVCFLWWQLRDIFDKFREDEPILTSICFKWVGSTTT